MDHDRLAAAAQRALVRVRAAGASKEQAEDCVQDAVVDLLAAKHNSQVEKPEAWLTTVSRRRFVDQLRRRRREQTALARTDAETRILGIDPSEAIADRDQARWMAAALDELPATTREVVRRAGAGMPQAEIAAELGLSARSVESHLTRARRLLRRLAAAAVLPVCAAAMNAWRWLGGSGVATAKVALAAVSVPVALGTVSMLPTAPDQALTPQPPPAVIELPNSSVSPSPQHLPPADGTGQDNPPPSSGERSRQGDQHKPGGSSGKGNSRPDGHGRSGDHGRPADTGRPADNGPKGEPRNDQRNDRNPHGFGWSGHKFSKSGQPQRNSFAGKYGSGRQQSGGHGR